MRVSDKDLAGILRNHLTATYMSFIISELADEQINLEVQEEE